MGHNMQRRDFLKAASAAGLGLLFPLGRASAEITTTPYGGPYWITVHAGGGWDPIFSFDPKPNNPSFNDVTSDKGTVGAFSYSPMPIDPVAMVGAMAGTEASYAPYLMTNEAFLQKRGAQLTLLNGINTGTNNHDTGTKGTWSGAGDGYPAFAAMVAATYGATQPLAFISSGGYDASLDLVALSRVSSASQITSIARPNQIDGNPNNTYFTDSGFNRINQFQAARLTRLQAQSTMARAQRSQSALLMARAGAGQLANVSFSSANTQLPAGLGDMQGNFQQTDLVLSAFQAGISVAASMEIGGFDTHSNHDRGQLTQLAKILGVVDNILTRLSAYGIADKTYVLVGSEFGRGPQYNMNQGKDHWPVTSMMVFGPNIPGGRVIGATNSGAEPLQIDPSSLQVSSTGVDLTPASIHKALRKVAGVTGKAADNAYPLLGNELPLFS